MMHKNFLLIAAAVLVAAAFLLMIVPGFRFSIILCFLFAALLAGIFLLLKYPTPLSRLMLKLICVAMIAGAVAAAITGSFIVRAAHPGSLPDCQYIVVLGAGVRGTVPSLTLSERIQAAYDYLIDHPDTTAILCGGQGPDEQITEAACIYRELTKLGIDGNRLLLEENSTSTMENLRFALDVAEHSTGTRPHRIGIVSSEYHLFRASLFADACGVESVLIPAQTTHLSQKINHFMREVAGVWYYLILGGQYE